MTATMIVARTMLRAMLRTILHQPVEVHANVRRRGRRMGEADWAGERLARLGAATELHEQRAFDPEEMEIAGQASRQRLDHRERGGRTAYFRHRDRAIERDHRRRRQ